MGRQARGTLQQKPHKAAQRPHRAPTKGQRKTRQKLKKVETKSETKRKQRPNTHRDKGQQRVKENCEQKLQPHQACMQALRMHTTTQAHPASPRQSQHPHAASPFAKAHTPPLYPQQVTRACHTSLHATQLLIRRTAVSPLCWKHGGICLHHSTMSKCIHEMFPSYIGVVG